ncbi:HK97 gp10 family phage protein [Eubacteriales bacterium OttesenSCG-928-N13]|nr:HK97 gp10 family phage protein [Eubacteriales bacterium OttesenSCG-928-N13]
MAVDLRGFDDLENDLTSMAAALDADGDGAAVNRALVSGAEPIERQMLANASSDPAIITGALHGSIHAGNVKKRAGGGKHITVGVHHKEQGAYYANAVEYGHGGPAPAPAHPFVRPAYDTEIDSAYEAMKHELRAALSQRA